MKRIYFSISIVALIFSGCVDNYTKSNPPHLLDAPTFRVSAPDDDASRFSLVPINQFENGYAAIVTYTAPVVFTCSVIDARGLVGDVTASISVPDYGTVTLDDASVAALKGKSTGEFKFTFNGNPDYADLTTRNFNLVVTVSDTQKDEKGEDAHLVTTITIPVTLYKCLTEIPEGTYMLTDASGELDGGSAFTIDDLLTDSGQDTIFVSVSEVRPGRFTFDEVTGGVWPTYYSPRANPALDVSICGSSIEGFTGAVTTGEGGAAQRKFSIEGTINEDASITISWTYVRETGNPPSSYAFGTYTMKKVP